MYFETMIFFQTNPVELPKTPSHKKNIQSLLHAIGCGRYMKKMNDNLLPIKKRKPRKKPQEKKDEIIRNLQTAN